jgi:hypothetical protein
MAKQGDYFPTRLADTGPWADNFLTQAGAIGWDLLFIPESGAMDGATTAFNAAYALSIAPATRTPVTVQATQTAYADLDAATRILVTLVQALPATSPAEQAAAGITVTGGGGAPSIVPVLAPTLEFRMSQPGFIKISTPGIGTANTLPFRPPLPFTHTGIIHEQVLI